MQNRSNFTIRAKLIRSCLALALIGRIGGASVASAQEKELASIAASAEKALAEIESGKKARVQVPPHLAEKLRAISPKLLQLVELAAQMPPRAVK